MIEYVFYAKQKGAPEYTCEIIGVETVKPTDAQLEAITRHCESKGLEFVRYSAIDLSKPPDFTKAVTPATTKRIMKRDVGRSMDFRASDGQVVNGHILAVRNGIASVEYGHNGQGPFITYLPVRDKSIVEVY